MGSLSHGACGRAAGPDGEIHFYRKRIKQSAPRVPPPPWPHEAASKPHVCFAPVAPRLRRGVHCLEIAVKRGTLGPRHEAELSVWVVRRPQPPCLTCLATYYGDMLGLDRTIVNGACAKVRVERALPGRKVSCSSPHARRAAGLALARLAAPCAL